MRILKILLAVAGLLLAAVAGVFAIAVVVVVAVVFLLVQLARRRFHPTPRKRSSGDGDVIDVTATEAPARDSESGADPPNRPA